MDRSLMRESFPGQINLLGISVLRDFGRSLYIEDVDIAVRKCDDGCAAETAFFWSF